MKRTIIIALALLAGCASPPAKIKAIASTQPCTAADRQRLADLYNAQSRTARNDAIGVFMIGIPMGGEDHAPEIARLKGRCGEPPKT
ncbi:hypothetical protein L2449_27170 [Mesorhizobium muleiense]|uniref:hypothetical protein n=1 Tax=Mesorhizobium muleiense TaxID=1004279 RepID=UPI001F1CA6FD|nr:hypothetical protein [Mesorhizobium muleiense]MCF6120510.1 hypothetical protein [Mesorhizobium muleiense]